MKYIESSGGDVVRWLLLKKLMIWAQKDEKLLSVTASIPLVYDDKYEWICACEILFNTHGVLEVILKYFAAYLIKVSHDFAPLF